MTTAQRPATNDPGPCDHTGAWAVIDNTGPQCMRCGARPEPGTKFGPGYDPDGDQWDD